MTDTITKQEPKLSVRKPGHWRNKAWAELWDDYSTGEGWGDNKFVSKELAEEAWFKALRSGYILPTTIYLGPVFFPEGESA